MEEFSPQKSPKNSGNNKENIDGATSKSNRMANLAKCSLCGKKVNKYGLWMHEEACKKKFEKFSTPTKTSEKSPKPSLQGNPGQTVYSKLPLTVSEIEINQILFQIEFNVFIFPLFFQF